MTLNDARQAARQGNFAPLRTLVPYAAFLDVRIEQLLPSPVFRLPYRASLIGNSVLPALHGGVVAGFMENAAQLHLLLLLDENKVPKSIDFSIDYLRSANAVDSLVSCDVARLGRRVAQVQIRCWQAAKTPADADEADAEPGQRLVALARAHFLLEAHDETGS